MRPGDAPSPSGPPTDITPRWFADEAETIPGPVPTRQGRVTMRDDRVYRFFLEAPPVAGEARLCGTEYHHLRNVLRLGVGAQSIIFNGAGAEYEAQIVSLGRTEAVLRVSGDLKSQPPSRLPVTLAWALCKTKATDWLIRKATELGVTRLQPFIAARSIAKPGPEKRQTEKWRRLTIEAAKQCGENHLPEIGEPMDYADLLGTSRTSSVRALLTPEAKVPLREVLRGQEPNSVWLAVGPEGGFTAGEVQAASEAGLQLASLGANTLRTETACLAALAAVRYELAGGSGP